jgi:hypothetical protein
VQVHNCRLILPADLRESAYLLPELPGFFADVPVSLVPDPDQTAFAFLHILYPGRIFEVPHVLRSQIRQFVNNRLHKKPPF